MTAESTWMVKRVGVLLLVLLGAALFSRWGAEPPLTAREEALVRGVNELGLELLRRCPTGNQLLSPVGVAAAWAPMYAGSRGPTAETLARTLRYPEPPETLLAPLSALLRRVPAAESWTWSQAECSLACGLFATPGALQPAYQEAVSRDAGLECQELSGDPVGQLNAWGARETHDRIRSILSPEDVPPHFQAAVISASAVYFKCFWRNQFPEASSRDDYPFRLEGGGSVPVRMMQSRRESRFRCGFWPEVQVLEMSYLSAHPYSMLVLLPPKLTEFEAGLTLARIESLRARLEEHEVVVCFPRFRFERTYDLLAVLGVGAPFDFSGMSDQPFDNFKSKQKTWIEVNERGTEAAAVTNNNDFVVGGGGPPYFAADHPFLFLVRDDVTGCFLFAGRVANPQVGR